MVLHCYKKWGFCKKFVLDCHTICTQLFGVHQGVIYDCTQPYCFVEDQDSGHSCLRIVVYCDCLKYWHYLYDLVCVSVWHNVTLLARKCMTMQL